MILAALLVSSCATWRASAGPKHPIPPAIEPLALDRCWVAADGRCGAFAPGYSLRWSLPTEKHVSAEVGYTVAAWQLEQEWVRLLIRSFCEAREVLQIANGEKATAEGICKP